MSKKSNPTKKSPWGYYIGGLFVLVIVVAIVFGVRQPAEPVLPTAEQVAEDVQDILEQPLFQANYDYILPTDWEYAEVAQNTINESQGKDEGAEKIQFGIVQDPNIKEWFYFATVDANDSEGEFLGIYRYETDTRNWERLYKETNVIEEPGDFRYNYHILGYDEQSLIVQRAAGDFSPGPCAEPLLLDTQTTQVRGEDTTVVSPLYAMSLENPYGNWQEHELPEDVREQYEATQTECEKELGL